LRETEDGFRIAEEDLRAALAPANSWAPARAASDMRLADLAAHAELLQAPATMPAVVIERRIPTCNPTRSGAAPLLYLFRRDDAVRTLRAG